MITVKQYQNTGANNIPSLDVINYFKPVVDGKELSMIAETEDVALLIGIGYKHDGANSQFAKMAVRMLNIKSAWGE
jgi:hypothetical protein